MRRRSDSIDTASSSWLMTLNDLLFLLLTFFVLFYAGLDFSKPSFSSVGDKISPEARELETALQESLAGVISDLPAVETRDATGARRVRFGEGGELSREGKALALRIFGPFTDGEELPFKTSGVLSVAARIATEHQLFIELQLRTGVRDGSESKSRAQNLTLTAVRQILDAGFPASRISAYGHPDSRTEELTILLQAESVSGDS